MEKILNNLFDFTREIKITLKPTDPAALIKDVINLLQTDFKRQHIQLTLDIENIPLVKIDKEQIHLALVHILKNSVEAMPKGGSLSISLQHQRGNILITIQDSGCGILNGHSKRITEPFFTTKVYGTGLGLSFAQKAIDLHGGSLTFEQAENRGTIVRVELPR